MPPLPVSWYHAVCHPGCRGHACLSTAPRSTDGKVSTQSRCRSQAGQRSIAMASIPIQNETDYMLTEAMTQQIIRDAQEHFGEEVRAIRVQSGIERHALNARTW